MIDIHTHILYGVDHGASTIEDSFKMIEEELSKGVTEIVCTPHYRTHMFEAPSETVINNFNILKEACRTKYPNLKLYLGREIYYKYNLLDEIKAGKLETINGSTYCLLEFSTRNETDIPEVVYNMKCRGFNVIVAHIERYPYITSLDTLEEIKAMGGLIQVNAAAITGFDGFKQKKKVLKYIKNGLIDFVGSDIHIDRENVLDKAYKMVEHKFGKEKADDLFYNNQKALLIKEEVQANA